MRGKSDKPRKQIRTRKPPQKNKHTTKRQRRALAIPYVLTPQVIETLVKALKRGSYPETAALAAGIVKTTFYDWLRKGNEAIKEGDESKEGKLYADLVHQMNAAMAFSQERDIGRMEQFIELGDAQMLRWKMGKRYKENWGEEKQHIHSHAHNHKHQGEAGTKETFKLDLSKLPVEVLRQLWNEMQKQKQLPKQVIAEEGT